MTTREKLYDLISQKFELHPRELNPESTLESLGMDSLAVIELLFDIEESFGLMIPHDNLHINTLGDLTEMIDKLLSIERTQAA